MTHVGRGGLRVESTGSGLDNSGKRNMRFRKKVLLGALVGVVLLAATVMMFRDAVLFTVMGALIAPNHEFDAASVSPSPDYSNSNHWAALPDRSDWADRIPSGDFIDGQDLAEVDVFFVHPTTYVSAESWNQPLDDVVTNERTDKFVMEGQASVFNGCCRVYAPRYRQATLYSFFDAAGTGQEALGLAYEDVVSAFNYYLDHFSEGRPFVLAGHSQGSHHVDVLLAKEIVGTTLVERLVAAYPVGFPIDGSNGLPVCETPTQTGCQATWNAVGPKVGPFLASSESICVNPLTWRADRLAASHDLNIGAVNFGGSDIPEIGVADAECREGRLWVSDIRSNHYLLRPLGRDNYHIYDYALFYLNLRKNVEMRVNTFLLRMDREDTQAE